MINKNVNKKFYKFSNILKAEAQNEAEKQIYSQLGYHIGRWIYLIDATDDLEDDKKRNNFNPLLLSKDITKQECQVILSRCLAQAYDAYNLLDIVDFKGILDNIMLKGLPIMQEQVLSGTKGEQK